jgi:hypothetical protein
MRPFEAWIGDVARAVAWTHAGILAPDDEDPKVTAVAGDAPGSAGDDASGAQLVDHVEK